MKKQLIQFFSLFVAFSCVFVAGCSSSKMKTVTFKDTDTFTTLGKVTYPEQVQTNYNAEDKIDVTPLQNFTVALTKMLYQEKENYVFSPISLYMALSMLTEGATDETLNELMILLGITSLENNQNQMGLIYNHNYYNNSYGQVRMANSLWINQRRVEEGYIQTLASKYFAESYYTSFNEQGKDNILRWINNYTNNFLHLTKENYDIDSNTALLLLNTIYFNNKWANEFNKADSYVGDFTTLDGIVSANYMKHTVSSVFSKSKNAQTITDTFENKNTIRFILPNEGVAISDLLNPSELFENKLLQADVQATISIPKFHHQKSFLLNDALSSLGASRMFMDVGEFGKINREVFVSFVRQDVGIEFSEKGVKAAAVSSIGMKDSAAEPLETMSINLNRPFIYIIYDSKSVPLFIGIVQNPNLTK